MNVYKTASFTAKDNIMTNNTGGLYCASVPSGYVVSYNDAWNNKGANKRNPAVDYTGCKAGTGSVYVDPQYVGSGANEMEKHELKSTSPVLKAGESGTKLGWIRPPDAQDPVVDPIVMVNGVFTTHPDHLGSSSVTTDSSGAVKQVIDYYPYGDTRYEKHASD